MGKKNRAPRAVKPGEELVWLEDGEHIPGSSFKVKSEGWYVPKECSDFDKDKFRKWKAEMQAQWAKNHGGTVAAVVGP